MLCSWARRSTKGTSIGRVAIFCTLVSTSAVGCENGRFRLNRKGSDERGAGERLGREGGAAPPILKGAVRLLEEPDHLQPHFAVALRLRARPHTRDEVLTLDAQRLVERDVRDVNAAIAVRQGEVGKLVRL